jgi:hypothetical protein
MGWFGFGNKFKKLKRDDVVNSICDLETQLNEIENGIAARERTIGDLMQKGRRETSRELKLFHAKRIVHLRDEKENLSKRGMYILYNVKLLNQLKDTIDDDNFIRVTAKTGLSDLLRDQKGLANFLNKALNTKTKQEEILTTADDLFAEVKAGYTENQTIYGASENDDSLLAVFEVGADDLDFTGDKAAADANGREAAAEHDEG